MHISEYWLVIKRNGVARLTKKIKRLAVDDVVVNLDIHVPDELFDTPRFSAKIDITGNEVGTEHIHTELLAAANSVGIRLEITKVEETDD